MPINKLPKVTLSEIQLLIPDEKKAKKKLQVAKVVPEKKPVVAKKNSDVSQVTKHTVSTSSVINPPSPKPILKPCVTVQSISLHGSDHPSEIYVPKPKTRGFDFGTPKNSHYDMIMSAEPNIECPTTSTSATPDKQQSLTPTSTADKSSIKTTAACTKPRNLLTPQWRKPCKGSFMPGAPARNVGYCPPTLEQIATMSKQRQKFFLTQDPRQKYCLRNPDSLHAKPPSKSKEMKIATDIVKYADNLCTENKATAHPFLCEIIDTENPLQLDFQGLDYKNTYEQDEQNIDNIRAYTQVGRYMDRKRVKAETQATVERELQDERIALPKCFEVPDRNVYPTPTPSIKSIRYGQLVRSTDKSFNRDRIEKEHEERKQRYKDLYLAKKEKQAQEDKKRQEEEIEKQEKLPATLAVEYFNNMLKEINHANDVDRNQVQSLKTVDVKQRTFPHTLQETKEFKRKVKEKNRVLRDEMRVRQEFFLERSGKVKEYPEANLEISSDSPRSRSVEPLNEQSTDDEDNIEVGKKGSTFKLRGFHYKLGKNIRGKTHKNMNLRKFKTCITREQWLQELAPKKERVKLDVEVGIQKLQSPDDPNLLIFPPQFGFKAPHAESAVKKFIEKPLGEHYKQDERKNIKILKPKLKYRVKKFNLINYIFGAPEKRQFQVKDKLDENVIVESTADYMKQKAKEERRKHQKEKLARLKVLGIPCDDLKRSRVETKCESTSSDTDSDWVPAAEPEYRASEQGSTLDKKIPFRKMGNMPAPKFRETTLRRHPRTPRQYELERVPTELFDDAVKSKGIPHMRKMQPDVYDYANVKTAKRAYTSMLNTRHHHDHWLPTKKTLVDVHYQPKIVQPEITKKSNANAANELKLFDLAQPPCNKFINMDLSLVKADTSALIAEKLLKSGKTEGTAKTEKIIDLCQTNKRNVFHSRPAEDVAELDFPGYQDFLDFLYEVRDAFKENKIVEQKNDEEGTLLKVDKEELYKELEDELKSIESCLTSLSESVCTNLTNDSGSFLLVEGKTKVPLDYIRKSVVPFEELQRSRFKTELIDLEAEENNPFQIMPYSGQLKVTQRRMRKLRDIFFTYNTRLRNGLRLRLQVPVEDVRKILMGYGRNKYNNMIATDIDETYVEALKHRLPVKTCPFKTGGIFIKSALRLKFESLLIQGQIVRNKIYDRLNEQHWQNMLRAKVLYERLFAKWEKKEYDAAREIVYKVKDYYDTTDRLKREARELERLLTLLNMDIVFIEGFWIRRIMLQNFHYLMADQEWRYQNDWIHRQDQDEDELESYEDSIAKRSTINIRQREKDDAWAIKTFYEEVYLKQDHPILIVFPDTESFRKGIENLKLKTFFILLELHYTLWIHTELQDRLESFEVWCIQDLKEREEDVSRKCFKLYYMEDRATFLKNYTLKHLNEPIEKSFRDEHYNFDRAIIAEAFRQIVPGSQRGSETSPDAVVMISMISNIVMDIIEKFDHVDTKTARHIEAELRRERASQQKQSRIAYQLEKRIEKETKRIIKSLEPPYVKVKRVAKLKQYHLKKKKEEVKVEQSRVSENTKLFFRAFHDEGDTSSTTVRDSLIMADKMQEHIVPFYFDHFLKLNGYTPNYNFKTQIEIRDGPEVNRFDLKQLIPEVLDRIAKWEENRKKIMEENIERNPKMYENVI